jgi:1,4-dihydroxy-2-naphthoate polyprenyltransferase
MFQIWLAAARPRTLWAALAPVLVGSALAMSDGVYHAPSGSLALLAAMLMQIGTNFSNDYSDFKKGADTETRRGPLRVTQAGLIRPRTMAIATMIMFALAMAVALLLVMRAGWPLAVLGVVCVLAGLGYTAGPYPYGYRGLGELFVLIFFGPVAVGGTYYVQALTLTPQVVVAGLGPGFLAVAILVVNNLRDREEDAKAGKRTLAVRFGAHFARMQYLACIAGTLAVTLGMVCWQSGHTLALVALAIGPMAYPGIKGVLSGVVGAELNPVLAFTAKLLLYYSVLFSLGWVL